MFDLEGLPISQCVCCGGEERWCGFLLLFFLLLLLFPFSLFIVCPRVPLPPRCLSFVIVLVIILSLAAGLVFLTLYLLMGLTLVLFLLSQPFSILVLFLLVLRFYLVFLSSSPHAQEYSYTALSPSICCHFNVSIK